MFIYSGPVLLLVLCCSFSARWQMKVASRAAFSKLVNQSINESILYHFQRCHLSESRGSTNGIYGGNFQSGYVVAMSLRADELDAEREIKLTEPCSSSSFWVSRRTRFIWKVVR